MGDTGLGNRKDYSDVPCRLAEGESKGKLRPLGTKVVFHCTFARAEMRLCIFAMS